MQILDADQPLCGARTRAGGLCRRPKLAGRSRCRLHGGAPGSGAPAGKRNGRYTEGEHTREAKAKRRWVRQIVRAALTGDAMPFNTPVPVAPAAHESDVPAPAPKPQVATQVIQSPFGAYRTPGPLDTSPEAWAAALKQALGTTSEHFVEASLRRLMAACMLPGEAFASTLSLSAALALIQGLGPEDEAQAALAVNAACLHAACTNVLSRLQPGGGDRRVVYLATAVARLERAFQGAVETFYRVKRGHTQVIRVEKIEIQPGAQAIVGPVSRG